MPLELRVVTLADFAKFRALKHFEGGDLIAPATPLFYHVEENDAATADRRNQWSLWQQECILRDDPTVTYIQVVDTHRNDEPISLGRWHYYEKGYKHPEYTAQELHGKPRDGQPVWPEGANGDLAAHFLNQLFEERPRWTGERPMWVLTTVMTRSSERRRGAGSMIVNWGAKKAEEQGVPAFIEAAVNAKSLYQSCGFKQVGEHDLDFSKFGFPNYMVAHMAFNDRT